VARPRKDAIAGHCHCHHGAIMVTVKGEWGALEGAITWMLVSSAARSMHSSGGAMERGSGVLVLIVGCWWS